MSRIGDRDVSPERERDAAEERALRAGLARVVSRAAGMALERLASGEESAADAKEARAALARAGVALPAPQEAQA